MRTMITAASFSRSFVRNAVILLLLALVFIRPASAENVTTTAATENTNESAKQPALNYSVDDKYERAIVREVGTLKEEIPNGGLQKKTYTIEFLSGALRGQTKTLSSDVISNPYQLEPRPGDRVVILLQQDPNNGEFIAYLEGFDRLGAMLWLVALFVLTLILLAGWQGVKTAFSILLSIALIGWILIPSFLRGVNPVPVAIFLAAVLATISSVLSMGWNKKALVTIIGTIGGVIVAYIISKIFGDWAHLSGLSTEEDRMFFEKNSLLNPQGLLFSGIIIAAMGVVEDVAVSIASGVLEVKRANPQSSTKTLFRSGMIIGRDHMSALANTLIFAYVGASLSTLLLYTQYGGSWLKFLNFDVVSDEIVRSLSGTIGLVFTVPITAILAAIACIAIKHDKTEITKPGLQ
ncbi:MAG: YibE/F family protein [Patescibacteria group bacterium]